MSKKNCWEVNRCGRQPGGPNAAELGACPAASARDLNGLNGGHNGGRLCWAIAGTLCEGKVQGSFAMKAAGCLQCDFYQQVRREEGAGLVLRPG